MNVFSPHQFKPAVHEDVWVPSSCALCYGTCSILAHRVDGTVIKIEGNPDSAVGKGRLCGKGVSGIMTHYDPNRLRYPMRRTNPKKGLYEDPGWKRISWTEALDEIAEVLRKVRADDPRKLVVQRTTTVTASRVPLHAFASAFGTPNFSVSGGGLHCGNGAHLISGIMHASWSVVPDFEYCNYAIFFGASKGHSAGHASCSNMGKAADARVRGMKMVVVDPLCNFAAAKATEWVPLARRNRCRARARHVQRHGKRSRRLRWPIPASQDQRALSDRSGQALRAPSGIENTAGLGYGQQQRAAVQRGAGRPTWRSRASSRSTERPAARPFIACASTCASFPPNGRKGFLAYPPRQCAASRENSRPRRVSAAPSWSTGLRCPTVRSRRSRSAGRRATRTRSIISTPSTC